MSRFYMTLPSNSSMDYYPENTVVCYTTKLANAVELDLGSGLGGDVDS